MGFPGLTLPEAAAPEPGHALPEVRLWVAVIERAIGDSCSQAAGERAGPPRSQPVNQTFEQPHTIMPPFRVGRGRQGRPRTGEAGSRARTAVGAKFLIYAPARRAARPKLRYTLP